MSKTIQDHVPYAVLDKWWMTMIEDGRFHCTQDALAIFPLDHASVSPPEERFRVVIEWHENGLKKQMETRADNIGDAMIRMWRRWIASKFVL